MAEIQKFQVEDDRLNRFQDGVRERVNPLLRKTLGECVPVPTSPTATGRVGQFAVESGFLYLAVGENAWMRVALGAF